MRRPRPMLALVLWLAVLGALPMPGCTATPLPDPPALEEVDLDPMGTSTGDEVRIAGGPGAADPELTVHAVNLDSTDPPVTATAGPSGAFELVVSGNVGDVVRMQTVEDDGRRSTPVDVQVTDGPAMAVAPLLGECLRMDRDVDAGAVEVSATETQAIEIVNDCDEEVVFGGASFRAPVDGLTLVSGPPATLAAGSRAGLAVEVAPAGAGPLEEVLLLAVDAPSSGRRAITVRARAP